MQLVVLSAFASILVAACGGSDKETLVLNLSGLEPLANGYHYKGWAIIDGSPVTTGKFNITANGSLVDLAGSIIKDGEFDTGVDLANATDIILTIEPAGDVDTIPSATHYVAGSVTDLSADLRAGHGAALGDSFASSSGTYILATPTDDADAADHMTYNLDNKASGFPSGAAVIK